MKMALRMVGFKVRIGCTRYCNYRKLCSPINTETFQYGEFCIVKDKKQRKHLIKLKEGGKLNRSRGYIKHADLIGLLPGSEINDGEAHLFRPTLEEYVLLMRRGPTPTYPKDAYAMMSMMDVSPGCHVVEAGSGSGAMTLFLSRAGDSLAVKASSIFHRLVCVFLSKSHVSTM